MNSGLSLFPLSTHQFNGLGKYNCTVAFASALEADMTLNSNAQLSSTKIDFILNLKEDIYEQNHHFDIALALKNFDNRKVTLKDVSTLSTIVIKCCRGVDNYYFQGIAKLSELNIL